MNHPLSIALIGNPNCGKTALFNRLTGSHQKVANYAGVTVERKEGSLTTEAGRQFHIIDLPGIYSLTPLSQDEEITRSAADRPRQKTFPSIWLFSLPMQRI